MLDLFAAIQSADPPSLVLWSLFVFAAGMYPVGFMLGSTCSPCCSPCMCVTGELPETLTLSIDNFGEGVTQGPDLIELEVISDFGGGATARVTAPGGDPDTAPGPITAVSVTNGGSGYARIARVAPAVTASVAGGSGASLSVTLSQTTDTAWNGDGRQVWQVASVSVASGGTGYADGQSVTFNAGTGGTALANASATARTNRIEPTVTASVATLTGADAVLGVTLTQTTDWNGDAVWSVSALTITAAGSGYQVGDQIQAAVTDGVAPYFDSFYAEVTAVDEDGAITAVAIYAGGEYYKDGGVIQSVVVQDGGAYYKEDETIPGEQATISVVIRQYGPTSGVASGAVLQAVVDTTVGSSAFGQITGITAANAGDDYLAWQHCEAYIDGMTVVLSKNSDCTWARIDCGRTFLAQYQGPSQPLLVSVMLPGCNFISESTFDFALEAESMIENCSAISVVASDQDGRSVSVTGGGTALETTCNDCIGTVTVAGQELEIGGPYKLICVEPYMNPPVGDFFGGFYHAYGFARAYAFCGHFFLPLTEPPRIFVRVDIGMRGIVAGLVAGPIESVYDTIAVGDEGEDADFAPYNAALTGVTRTLMYGPTAGDTCVQGQPQEINVGIYENSGAASIPCATELAVATRTPITADVACNVSE